MSYPFCCENEKFWKSVFACSYGAQVEFFFFRSQKNKQFARKTEERIHNPTFGIIVLQSMCTLQPSSNSPIPACVKKHPSGTYKCQHRSTQLFTRLPTLLQYTHHEVSPLRHPAGCLLGGPGPGPATPPGGGGGRAGAIRKLRWRSKW